MRRPTRSNSRSSSICCSSWSRESLADLRRVPVPSAQLEERAADRLLGLRPEETVEGVVRPLHAELLVQDEDRLGHGLDDGIREIALFGGLDLGGLLRMDVHEREHRTVDLVLDGAIRLDLEEMPASVAALDLELPRRGVVDEFREVRDLDVRTDVLDRAPDVGGDQVQQLLRRRREAPDPSLVAQHDDRDLDAVEQVHEVVVDADELRVPVLQLLVQRRELLVRGLELLLGGVELLVGGLELLVRREDLLVGRLQLLVGRLLLLDHGLEVLPGRDQLPRETLDLAAASTSSRLWRRSASARCPRRPASWVSPPGPSRR